MVVETGETGIDLLMLRNMTARKSGRKASIW